MKERFFCFLEEQLVCNILCLRINTNIAGPTTHPLSQRVVVLSNCAIHHDEEIHHIVVEECGMFSLVALSDLSLTCVAGARLHLPASLFTRF
jgi:hypothetical protein